MPERGNASLQWIFNRVFASLEYSALKIFQWPHWMVHEGRAFEVEYSTPHGSEIANDASFDVALHIGKHEAHLTFGVEAGGDSELFIYENSDVALDGTELSVLALNRVDGTFLSDCTARLDPTVNGVGVELRHTYIPGGTGPQSQGGNTREGVERIWKPDTTYLFRTFNRSGQAKMMGLLLQFYLS
jgi:hypothetical protein